ncbi:flavin reductase family protein [Streptomyces peucetius]|uniref:Flavin reductase family protein n=1 Tax=Streptomyces peucetius TaxID=1950 RepID=A0ABY6IDD3_STRPE|nr:flavin reductase family protein [Streptomyces peucetius]UYQ65007.1 flavin reductase family protein [Streptomyces peucetius]
MNSTAIPTVCDATDKATGTDHLSISPSILYFGTPVALLTTENPDGTPNLAPVSSAWALGHTVVLGLGAEGHTVANLADRPELVVSLPSPDLWAAVERLAPLTGADPVPAAKRGVYRHERDKFAACGLHPHPSEVVGPPRVAECPLQFEARVRSIVPAGPDGAFRIVECEVVRVHASASVVVPGTQHIDPGAWSPLIYNFRHYFGLDGRELGHGFRSETAASRP